MKDLSNLPEFLRINRYYGIPALTPRLRTKFPKPEGKTAYPIVIKIITGGNERIVTLDKNELDADRQLLATIKKSIFHNKYPIH